MSLDVYLLRKKIVSYDMGQTFSIDYDELYNAKITHNLTEMAEQAGIYEALWRPHRLTPGYDIPEDDHDSEWQFEENLTLKADFIIPYLEKGIEKLKAYPDRFKKFNAANGWGTYENFVPFVEKYLKACKEHPDAIIEVSR